MARPNKFNLQYFPLDIDFFDDHKIICIEEEAGIPGGYMAVRLMAMVYADKGYFLEWPENFEFTVAKRIGNGVTGAFVNEILQKCFDSGLFIPTLFRAHRIITSPGIQKRWLKIQKDCRRKVEVNAKFWLLSSEETGFNVEEMQQDETESTQNKSKVNEIKLNNTGAAEAAVSEKIIIPEKMKAETQDAGPKKSMVKPTLKEVADYFILKQYHPEGPGSWEHGLCTLEATKFFNHYEGNGWVQGKNKPLKKWESAANLWIINVKQGTFSPPINSGSTTYKKVPHETSQRPTGKVLHPAEKDLNFCFQRFLETPAEITITYIEAGYYDRLKNAGKISFEEDKIAEIKTTATAEIKARELPFTEDLLKAFMKKIAVLEFFKHLQHEGATEIFSSN